MPPSCAGDKQDCEALALALRPVNERLAQGDLVLTQFQELVPKLTAFMAEWPDVKSKVDKSAEILTAWENLKGSYNTLAFLSKILKIFAVIGASLAGMYAAAKGITFK